MTTNQFFNHYDNNGTQNLYDDLLIEFIQIHGRDIVYLSRDNIDTDNLFGEGNVTEFDSGRTIEMFTNNRTSFDGNGDMFRGFDIAINDEVIFFVAKSRWLDVFDMDRPKAGDLVYDEITNRYFEVTFVDDETKGKTDFFKFGKNYCYTIYATLFTYTYESVNDDINDISLDLLDDDYTDDEQNIDNKLIDDLTPDFVQNGKRKNIFGEY